MKKSLLLLLLAFSQILLAQITELNWSQIEVVKFGNEITYKLKHNYDFNTPDKPNNLLNGTYKIGDNYGKYVVVSFKAGKTEGLWKEYDMNGKLVSTGNYKNSKPDGVFIDYFGNGDIQKKTHYKNGKEHGKSITYDRDGKVKAKQNYVDGKQDGKQEGPAHIFGYKDCRYVHYLKKGKPFGLWETKCRGKIVSSKDYVTDKEYTEKQYFKNEQLKRIKSYKNGRPHGEQKEYDIDGVLLKHYVYDEGILLTKKIFFETGDPKLVEHRNLDDERHGAFINYFENGNTLSKGNYKYGKKDGIWSYYHENGNVRSETTYKNGKKTGIYTQYYRSNKVVELKGKFFKNKRVGEWNKYSQLGNLIKVFTYKNGKLISERKIID
jgi:antitoxin component YwqK of YwqJK toxin-antitoxin module